MGIDPSQADQVASALLAYLADHLGVAGLRFAEPPQPIGRGFDTYIYAFRLAGDGLDPTWERPLVLRLYPNERQGDKAEREGAIQRFAAQRGYPALEPLALERNAGPFGLPIMVMERVAGVSMLERLSLSPLAVRRQFAAMADAHVALHRLPVDGCPLPSDGPLVERRLSDFRERIARSKLPGFDEALRWLEEHKDTVIPEELSLCHNDFHPLNIMVADDGRLTVLDWADASLGDRHHDVARTVALFRFAHIAGSSALERLVLRLSRGFLTASYLRPYRRQLPLDWRRLRYWEALHGFQGWLQLTELQDPESPAAVGARPESLQRLPADLIPQLERYFWQRAKPR